MLNQLFSFIKFSATFSRANNIAEKLNNMGVKTRRGGKWYASTVTNILKRAND